MSKLKLDDTKIFEKILLRRREILVLNDDKILLKVKKKGVKCYI
jgi:hypothetical protein